MAARLYKERSVLINHRHEKIIKTTPSTYDFMSNRQRPPIYYGGQKHKYYLTPSTVALPS
jgi:hypothetical protein